MDTRLKCWGNTKYYAINRKSRAEKKYKSDQKFIT